MIGDLGQTDTSILDNILSEAIARVYKRAAVRVDNKTPTYLDLRNELSTWTDEDDRPHRANSPCWPRRLEAMDRR
jgi:hypothetical protein